ncbi:heme-degrading domain-containing protein [Neorhizobium sp. SOG26]|uniref:heme-degrading domain-containing protein n=1 Tax=Neorhizobium sp. SOG26 TaxID=2060726 RepID=UPI000E580BB7|nr:heme-degrading domain-containing protein [Neorhizobium sp. SOG26]AXV15384.1 heme-degrading domain-containing protein [Neorhizobium sp. SOG26]
MAAAEERDIAKIQEQEQALVFDKFDLGTAFELGMLLRDMALEKGVAVAIDVRFHSMPAFYLAMPGTTADNEHWVRRKRNLVLRFFQSSYAIGRKLAHMNDTLESRYGLSSADYASHGGSFPLKVNGVGCLGAVTVSGLPQREDHNMVVEALCRMLGKDLATLQLERQ